MASAASDITGTWGRAGKLGLKWGSMEPPPPLKEPYATQWKALEAKKAAAFADGTPYANNGTRCLPDGPPLMMEAIYPMEFLQTPGQVTIIAEERSQIRRIWLDSKQVSLDDFPPGYYGNSVGHWSGNVLEVSTIGFKDDVRINDAPHSPQMELRERIHLVAPDLMHDDVTVIDPQYLMKPWSWSYAYKRLPGYHLMEFVCDNNLEQVDATGHTIINIPKR